MVDAPTPAPTGIVASSADGRQVTLRCDPHVTVQVGDYLSVANTPHNLLAFVERVSDGGEAGITAYGSFMVAPGPPIARVAPFSGMPAEHSPAEVVSSLLGSADQGLEIGALVAEPDVRVGLVTKRLNRHTFWCGQSGSGKTYALGVALERILLHTRLPMVVFDPNSDFVKLDTPLAEADPSETEVLAGRQIRVLRPGDGPDALRVAFRRLNARSKAAVLRLDPVVDRAEYNALMRLGEVLDSEQAGGVATALRSLDTLDSQALAERIENLGVLEWRIWAYGAESVTDVIDSRPDATVLDLGALQRHEEQLTVAMAVLDDLWLKREERRPVLIVIDEAHNLCPPDPESPLGRAVRDRVIQIAAEGRKFGLWLLLSTQRPSKVHRGIVSQCDNLMLMRMNSPNDIDELAEIFGFIPPDMLAQSKRFVQGEALLAGGVAPAPSVIKVRDRITVQGGIDVPVPLS